MSTTGKTTVKVNGPQVVLDTVQALADRNFTGWFEAQDHNGHKVIGQLVPSGSTGWGARTWLSSLGIIVSNSRAYCEKALVLRYFDAEVVLTEVSQVNAPTTRKRPE